VKYPFPMIKHIEEVRQAINDRTEFVEARRDGFIVFNYLVCLPDTFPEVETVEFASAHNSVITYFNRESRDSAIRRECRGITFCAETGKVVARKFHKFFNVGERAETDIGELDLTEKHVILEKLDGSMITPYHRADGTIEMHTKMGATDVAAPVTEWVQNHPNYLTFMKGLKVSDITPIFEWCSRKQRIVVDHPVDRLVLLAARHNVSGEYVRYSDLKFMAELDDIEIVKTFAGTAQNMQDLVNQTRDLEDAEGWIVRFDDGHMVKVKGEWYLQLHKAVSQLAHEKDIWNLVVQENSDDLKPFLSLDQRNKLIEFEGLFWTGFNTVLENINQILSDARHDLVDHDDRQKRFAVDYASKLPKELRGIAFTGWQGKSTRDALTEWVIKNTKTGSRVDQIRHHFNDLAWDEIEVE